MNNQASSKSLKLFPVPKARELNESGVSFRIGDLIGILDQRLNDKQKVFYHYPLQYNLNLYLKKGLSVIKILIIGHSNSCMSLPQARQKLD